MVIILNKERPQPCEQYVHFRHKRAGGTGNNGDLALKELYLTTIVRPSTHDCQGSSTRCQGSSFLPGQVRRPEEGASLSAVLDPSAKGVKNQSDSQCGIIGI